MSTSRPLPRALRYLAPNLLTTFNLVLGLLSLRASFEGRVVDAAWLIVYAVLTDKLDGLVARLVRGTSEFGVQLDSFADNLNFGLAPAVLLYTSLGSDPRLPFHDGLGQTLLLLACAAWFLGATFRLARYNVGTGEPVYPKIFFGVPTTLVGGLLVTWYLTLLKYTPPGAPMAQPEFGGPRLFGALETPEAVWTAVPVLLVIGGWLMASSLRMPKLGLARSRAANIFIYGNVLAGYVCGFARILPEYCIIPPTLWLVIFLTWGALSPNARAMKPPPFLPQVDAAPGRAPIRPEDDVVPDDLEPLDPPAPQTDRPS